MADGPAIRCRDQEQYEAVKHALASVKVQPGEAQPTLKAFAPVLIDAGLRALAAGAKIGPECKDRGGPVSAWIGTPPPGWVRGMSPPCIACGAAAGEPCRDPREARDEHEDDLARARGEGRAKGEAYQHAEALAEIERLKARLGAGPEGMIEAALAGVTSAPKRDKGNGGPVLAIDALHEIMRIEGVGIVEAVALALRHTAARLRTLSEQAEKAKAARKGASPS